jgi:hypothetical protein
MQSSQAVEEAVVPMPLDLLNRVAAAQDGLRRHIDVRDRCSAGICQTRKLVVVQVGITTK